MWRGNGGASDRPWARLLPNEYGLREDAHPRARHHHGEVSRAAVDDAALLGGNWHLLSGGQPSPPPICNRALALASYSGNWVPAGWLPLPAGPSQIPLSRDPPIVLQSLNASPAHGPPLTGELCDLLDTTGHSLPAGGPPAAATPARPRRPPLMLTRRRADPPGAAAQAVGTQPRPSWSARSRPRCCWLASAVAAAAAWSRLGRRHRRRGEEAGAEMGCRWPGGRRRTPSCRCCCRARRG